MILQRNTRCGFTLIEAIISIVLVGIPIAALLVSSQSLTSANGVGLKLSTAEFITEQIRERTIITKFDDLATTFHTDGFVRDGFDSASYPGYSQNTKVEGVNAADLITPEEIPDIPFLRITVTICLNNETISSASWLRTKY